MYTNGDKTYVHIAIDNYFLVSLSDMAYFRVC